MLTIDAGPTVDEQSDAGSVNSLLDGSISSGGSISKEISADSRDSIDSILDGAGSVDSQSITAVGNLSVTVVEARKLPERPDSTEPPSPYMILKLTEQVSRR